MAVYTEIERGCRWGIRVTLFGYAAQVEAIDGRHCSWYGADSRVSQEVKPPGWIARLTGTTFEQRLRDAVEEKRRVAEEENRKCGNSCPTGRSSESSPPPAKS